MKEPFDIPKRSDKELIRMINGKRKEPKDLFWLNMIGLLLLGLLCGVIMSLIAVIVVLYLTYNM